MTIVPEFHRPAVEGVRVDRDVRVEMRDGIGLAVDVYRPEDDTKRYPGLLAASAYQKDLAGLPAVPIYPTRETGPIEWYVKRGYVYVLADIRGSGKSEGRWENSSQREQNDLYDLIEWIAEQPWCTGNVGMIGQSYFGRTQWLAAVQRPPHLRCIAPYDAHVDPYRDTYFHGGIPSAGIATLWMFMVKGLHTFGPRGPEAIERFAVDAAAAMLEHPTNDEYWRERTAYWRLEDIDIPVFSIGNWGKNALHLRGNLVGFEKVRGPKKLHVEQAGRASLNIAKALMDFDSPEFHERVLAPWYDHWLKGEDTGVMDQPPVTVFVSGDGEYRALSDWPPPEASQEWYYLREGPSGAVASLNDGRLSPAAPSEEESSTTYRYPRDDWHVGTAMINRHGVANQVARILTFTSPPLEEDLTVIGPITLVLYASSDQLDTDFIVRLCDQQPAGEPLSPDVAPPAVVLSRGWLKASHRAQDPEHTTDWRPFYTHLDPEPLIPGERYRFEIEIWPIAHQFRRGHRIRLELANGDSSAIEGPFWHYYGVKAGEDTVYHEAGAASRLALPVVRP